MCSTKRPESAIAVAGLIEGNSGGESKASVEANFKCSPRQRLEILGFTQEDGWSFAEWDCPRCTFHNQMDALACAACDENLPIGELTPRGKVLASVTEELSQIKEKVRTMF